MNDRRAVVGTFERLAFASELLERNIHERQTYANLAWALRSFEGDFKEAHASGKLRSVSGLGETSFRIIGQVLAGEPVPELVALEAEVPAGLAEINELPGLGPKKIRALWQELGITTVGELEYACHENRLLNLKGFGEKTQAKVLSALQARVEREGLRRLDQALALAKTIELGVPFTVVGETRRCLEEVRSLLLLPHAPPSVERLAALGTPDPDQPGRFAHEGFAIQVLPAPAPEALGAALLAATGSDEHLAALADEAGRHGLRLAPDGLFRGSTRLETRDEVTLYGALELHFTPPERRFPGIPLTPKSKRAPRLIERGDLRGALHNHTVASDGRNSLREMRDAAAAAGLEYFAITEHSETANYARGLNAARIETQRREIAALNEEDSACRLLAGIESDILADGALDYPAPILATLSVVVASVHQRYGQRREAMTARVLAAVRNPWTDVIGHPTGRLLLGARPPHELDLEEFLQACAESGCAVELNGNPQRLDLPVFALSRAQELGIPISIAADAHAIDELSHLDYAIMMARRAGLRPEDVLNTRSLPELETWLAARKARASASA